MITIIRGPRASGKTTIAMALKQSLEELWGTDNTVLVLDEIDPENNRAFTISSRVRFNDGQRVYNKIDFDGNLTPYQQLYRDVIVIWKPGAQGKLIFNPSNPTFRIDTGHEGVKDES